MEYTKSTQPFLKGKTLFITGASRGIGREIALRAAVDGANIAVVAKTTAPDSKLPGTIFSVAKEVEDLGGKALAISCDIRFEDQIETAIANTVDVFGGIDIVINNASAISLTDTTMKKYDLMHDINVRGTFAVSKAAIPHLCRSSNPHIMNMSPPISMDPRWFSGHVAYTMSKYGMSMVAFGLSAELADKRIAVNALWPKTIIYTSALKMLASEDMALQSRKPSIVADAAYVIVTQPSDLYTGNFAIDEDVLRSQGLDDFDRYSVVAGSKSLVLDGFIEPDYRFSLPPRQILAPRHSPHSKL